MRNADRPRPDERILRRSGADLNNGWLGRHGTLSLTDERLVFVPTPLDAVLRAKRREIPLDGLRVVERWPNEPGTMPPGGRRPRMLLHTDECVYEFLLPDLDAWFDILQAVLLRRERRTGKPAPRFVREGMVNPLLEEDEPIAP